MCGICGIISSKERFGVDKQLLFRMRDSMEHRGPDDAGIYISRNERIGLGHRRLSIIDLSRNAKQPMSNEDKSIWLVCNGEIWNYKQLRKELEENGHRFKSDSDNEVIVHLYEDCGIELLEKIDGDFAFCLWDEKGEKLFIVRDRLGIKPCFYYKNSERVIFASEIKALLQDSTIPKELDSIALHHYLSFLSVPAPYTIYKGIKKLLPGHYLSVANGRTKLIKYWHLDKLYSEPLIYKKEEDYIEEFIYHLKKSIHKRLMSDVPLGVFLSGGIDSSIVVALMSEITHPVRTFSVIFDNRFSCDESVYSREIADIFNTEHYEYLAKPEIFNSLPKIANLFDEPFATPSAIPLYFLSEYASDKIKVALTGDGGDELFAGYVRYSWDRIAERLNSIGFAPFSKAGSNLLAMLPSNILPRTLSKVNDLVQKLLLSVAMEADRRYLGYFTFLSEDMKHSLYTKSLQGQIKDVQSVAILQNHYNKISKSDTLTRRTYGDIMTTLPDEMLTKGDRMAMVHSIENRVPILDQELVEFSARLPSHFKLRGRIGKYIVKKAMIGKLTSRFLYRRKAGFNVPLGHWLRNELYWLISEYFDKERIKRENIFNPQIITSLVKDFTDNNANLEYVLLPLLIFEIWYSECFKKNQ